MSETPANCIFDSFYIIGLKYEKGKKIIKISWLDIVPYIKFQHPKISDGQINGAIPAFCFPGWSGDDKLRNDKSLYFTFALQQGSGARKYGFCNRIINNENDIETLCILSDHPWFAFHKYLLLLLNAR